MAAVLNARFCSVKNAYLNSVGLTSGGTKLYNYARSAGWEELAAQTYDAAYALGNSGWASSQYTSNYIGASPASSVPGSGLIYMIHMHNLAQYDQIG
ncbi:hypothetical protein N007_17755 [Alicyclobacillus acidoterrestris ATCC 49025]|nr:hypothetical protein N007_17755 [Alicyclobacillus acidoterrestris ATCC 49025]